MTRVISLQTRTSSLMDGVQFHNTLNWQVTLKL